MKKWLSFGLGGAVSIGIFVLLVGSELGAVQDELERANYFYLVPCAVFLIAGLVTRAIRWHYLLDRRVSVKHCFHIINIGYFLSGILPLRLGDVARAWLTTRLESPVAALTSISTIVVERLLDLFAVLAMLGLTLTLLDVPREVTSAGVFIGLTALAGGVALAVLAARPKLAFALLAVVLHSLPLLRRFRLELRLEHFLSGIQPMGKPSIALNALLWSGVSWCLSTIAGYFLLFMVFPEPTLAAALAFIVLGAFSVALPAVPGNLGPFEGAVVGGLWIAGLIPAAGAPENAPAVAFAAIMHALLLGLYICFGLIGLGVEQASLQQVKREALALAERESQMQALAP